MEDVVLIIIAKVGMAITAPYFLQQAKRRHARAFAAANPQPGNAQQDAYDLLH